MIRAWHRGCFNVNPTAISVAASISAGRLGGGQRGEGHWRTKGTTLNVLCLPVTNTMLPKETLPCLPDLVIVETHACLHLPPCPTLSLQITDEEEDEEELRNVLSGFDASLLADAPDDDEEGSAAPLEEALGEDLAQFGDDADPEGDTDADMMAALEATRATALAEAQVMREANARAGVELALQMLPLWVRLGGGVSLADMRMLAKVRVGDYLCCACAKNVMLVMLATHSLRRPR